MNSFLVFCSKERSKTLRENPHLPNSDVSVVLGKRWREMSEEDKKPYYTRSIELQRVIVETSITKQAHSNFYIQEKALQASQPPPQRKEKQFQSSFKIHPPNTDHRPPPHHIYVSQRTQRRALAVIHSHRSSETPHPPPLHISSKFQPSKATLSSSLCGSLQFRRPGMFAPPHFY